MLKKALDETKDQSYALYHLTQAQLADAMGVDQAVISRWESGKVSPNAGNLDKLKEILS